MFTIKGFQMSFGNKSWQNLFSYGHQQEYNKWKVNDFKNRFGSARKSMCGKMLLLFLIQGFLIVIMMHEALNSDKTWAMIIQPPASIQLVLTRFLCAIFLHISQVGELRQGLDIMKYAQNHTWKFHNWAGAWFVGFFQMAIVISVEIVNLTILLTNHTIMETIMNFLALAVIVEFDDIFFLGVKLQDRLAPLIIKGEILSIQILGPAVAKQSNEEENEGEEDASTLTLEELTKIETTTSQKARNLVPGNLIRREEFDEEQKKDPTKTEE